jgi:hypothetical protein
MLERYLDAHPGSQPSSFKALRMSSGGRRLYKYSLANSRCRDGVQPFGRPVFPFPLPSLIELAVGAGD